MFEHFYTSGEKYRHLKEFIFAIDAIISHPAAKEHYPEIADDYKELLKKATVLLDQDFSQDEYSKLARQFRPFIDTYRDWEPPFARDQNGKLEIPTWYPEVEELHSRLDEAAERLKCLGYY